MKLIKIVFLSALSMLTLPVWGAVKDRAEDFFEVGWFDKADQLFRTQIVSNEGDVSLSYYYLGTMHRDAGRQDSAMWYFSRGLERYAQSPYLQFGKLSVERFKETKTVDKMVDELISDHRKDARFLRAVASYYMKADTLIYKDILEQLHGLKNEAARNSLLEGDFYMQQSLYGLASQQYEQAIYYDATLEVAFVKYAELYTHINPNLAIDKLNQYLNQYPTAPLAARELADIEFLQGNFSEALRNYEIYFANDDVSMTKDLERYATILFYSKSYDKATQCVNKVLNSEPDNLVMNRLNMYIASVQATAPNALQIGTLFMTKYPQSEYLSLDHYYYAQILRKNKNYSDALIHYENVLSSDSTKCDVLLSIVETAEAMQNYCKAVQSYELYMKRCPQLVKNSDYFKLGQDYYFLANAYTLSTDSLLKISYLNRADQNFQQVINVSPESSLGYFWKARTLASIDSETINGLAKPYYEKTLEIVLPEKKDIKKIIECYNYLGYYYYLQNNMTTSLLYWNKTLELDPQSEVAKKAIDGIQSSKPTKK